MEKFRVSLPIVAGVLLTCGCTESRGGLLSRAIANSDLFLVAARPTVLPQAVRCLASQCQSGTNRVFSDLKDRAKKVRTNCLTEGIQPCDNIVQQGNAFTGALMELGDIAEKHGEGEVMKTIKLSAFFRDVQDSKNGWDSHLAHAPCHVQNSLRKADRNIDELYRDLMSKVDGEAVLHT